MRTKGKTALPACVCRAAKGLLPPSAHIQQEKESAMWGDMALSGLRAQRGASERATLPVIARAGSNSPMVPMIFHNAKGTGSNSRTAAIKGTVRNHAPGIHAPPLRLACDFPTADWLGIIAEELDQGR